MHELGTVVYIMDTVEKLAVENELSEVASVTVEIGEVSGIIPEYIADFWLYSRKKSELLKNTELVIENLPAVTYCDSCGKTYKTVEYGKQCPHCGSYDTFLLTGNEYIIKEIQAM